MPKDSGFLQASLLILANFCTVKENYLIMLHAVIKGHSDSIPDFVQLEYRNWSFRSDCYRERNIYNEESNLPCKSHHKFRVLLLLLLLSVILSLLLLLSVSIIIIIVIAVGNIIIVLLLLLHLFIHQLT